jgi:hypothetical protein
MPPKEAPDIKASDEKGRQTHFLCTVIIITTMFVKIVDEIKGH